MSHILFDVSLNGYVGEWVCWMGHNGVGKTYIGDDERIQTLDHALQNAESLLADAVTRFVLTVIQAKRV